LSFNDYASGVYLGNGWVLTGYHVVRDDAGGFQFSNVIFNGQSYAADPSTAHRLTTPDEGLADLALFRLTTNPNLPSVTLSVNRPAVNSPFAMAGGGRNRAEAQTNWTVNTATEPDTWTPTAGTGDRQGYLYAAGAALRWGMNRRTTNQSANLTTPYGTTFMVRTQFDNDGTAVANEAQAGLGDSGGGVFYKNGPTWELAGIMLNIATYPDQPLESTVFGTQTYIADMSTYRTEILGIIPEPSSALLLLAGGLLLNRRCRCCVPE
jgi:hypothetical protein